MASLVQISHLNWHGVDLFLWDWRMGEQTFTQMSEITIRVTGGSDALIDLNDVNLGPRDIFVGKRAEHLPRRATATDGHDKFSTDCNSASGISGDDLGSTGSNIIGGG